MNTIDGFENVYAFPAHTAVGQGLRMVDVPDEARLQAAVELYDYVADGVEFEDEVAEVVVEVFTEVVVVPEEVEEQLDRHFLKRFAGGTILEAGKIGRGEGRAKYFVGVTMQEPSETFRQAKQATAAATDALLEDVEATAEAAFAKTQEVFEESLEAAKKALGSRRRKEAAEGAVSVVCGQIIYEHLERLGNPSIVDLIGSIQEDYPELPNEPQFGAIKNRLRERMKDEPVAAQEAYKQTFAKLDRQKLAEQMEAVPAFYRFCRRYGIDPNKVLEG